MNPIDSAIDDFNMLYNATKVIVGLSGGADSITLIHYLKYELHQDVVACHINHNLRGKESHSDMAFVVDFCKIHLIPLFIKDCDVLKYAKDNGMTTEEAGRTIRYSFFEDVRQVQYASHIATAHTLSDHTETVLFNLTRGAGLSGLCGIPPVRDHIIRPLIYSTRLDIEQYCKEQQLDYVVDSTNKESKYTRNNIRNNVIPVLKQLNQSFETAVLRNTKILRNDEDCLCLIAKDIYEKSKLNEAYQIEIISTQHRAIRHRVIGLILEENSLQKTADLILKVDSMIIDSKGKITVSVDIYIEIRDRKLQIVTEEPCVSYYEDCLMIGDYKAKSGELYRITKMDMSTTNITEKVYKKLLYILLDYDKIKGSINIRQRKTDDKIQFSNRVGTKSLKKFFIEEKMSRYEKSKTLVLADDLGVIAVFPYGVANRVAIDTKTKSVLEIAQQ